LNRELSWLAFNRRVVEEAKDESNPLLERVKLLAISANNLDEFFEIRVAALLQQIEDGYSDCGADGLTPVQVIREIAHQTHEMAKEQYRCWNEELRPALVEEGICIKTVDELSAEAKAFVSDYCSKQVEPLLTPVTVDPAHPFPLVTNRALCLALLLRRKRRTGPVYLGVITIPRSLPWLIQIPNTEGKEYVVLADVIGSCASCLYPGFEILSEAAFRITRNSNLYLQEEESRSLLETVRSELRNRHKGDAVRLEIDAEASPELVEKLRGNFELAEWQVFHAHGPVSLARLINIYDLNRRPELKFKPYFAKDLILGRSSHNIFDEIERRDILIHSPFDSYDSVVAFIEEAADDPAVESIKQTLYRTGEKSPIIDALVRAAARKAVTAVVELKARFDEAHNIRWSRHLEEAGVQVFHGIVGLKTHCKLTLVTRRESGELRQYAHLGTGNYNPETARVYTDLNLLTANEEITTAVHDIFNFLTAYGEHRHYPPLLVAPSDLAERILGLISREAEHARAGRPARIIAKMNSLLDRSVIQELYRASQAGVETDLIVRGTCALVPGLRGISSKIRVRSILGRFLEHSRIWYFENGGEPEVFVGSPDWMPRNLYERVEVVFPVKSAALRDRLRYEILDAYLADNCKAWLLNADGSYVRPVPRNPRARFSAQQFLMNVAEGKAAADHIPRRKAVSARRSASRKTHLRKVA
jgi:polyphosphate kinase